MTQSTTEELRETPRIRPATRRRFARVLVTGAHGFAGRFAVPAIAEAYPDAELFGASSSPAAFPTQWSKDVAARTRSITVDLRVADRVARLVAELRPDAVLHLAGQSRVHESWKFVGDTYATNVLGTVHLLDALCKRGEPCRFLFISSGDVYGMLRPADLPVVESSPPRPNSPYAASKLAAELAVRQLAESAPHIEASILRPFAHAGPGQSAAFVCSAFAQQVAMIEAHRQDAIIEVGNLEARRDLTDVRDIARAYVAALDAATGLAPLNICSGRSQLVESILGRLLHLSGVTIQVRRDPARIRPVDTPEIRGDSSAFQRATSWAPEIPFEQTLADLLDWWRAEVRRTA